MGNLNLPVDDGSAKADSGGEQPDTLTEGADIETGCDLDSELQLGGEAGEPATLYRDGVDLEDDYNTLAGNHGSSATIP